MKGTKERHEIISDFLCHIVPDEAKSTVGELLANPDWVALFNGGMHVMHQSKFKPTGDYNVDNALAINGILLGLAMGLGLIEVPAIENDMRNFLAHKRKVRGENVYDFIKYRNQRIAGKRPGTTEGPGDGGGTG